jgi:transposase-like protein
VKVSGTWPYAYRAVDEEGQFIDLLVSKTEAATWFFVDAKDPLSTWIVDTAELVTPAVWDLAATCHRASECSDHRLFDVRIDPSGRPWFLEASL